MEQEIKISSKLYEIRDTAKRFLSEDFEEKTKPHVELIHQVCKANKVDILESAIMISSLKIMKDNPFSTMLLFAAAVEMIEPTKDRDKGLCRCINWHPPLEPDKGRRAKCSYCKKYRQKQTPIKR